MDKNDFKDIITRYLVCSQFCIVQKCTKENLLDKSIIPYGQVGKIIEMNP